jgi:serine-type D-Ala-D-Ala carboxypeptidase/endopeptidase (penicillin-binding protein 4)
MRNGSGPCKKRRGARAFCLLSVVVMGCGKTPPATSVPLAAPLSPLEALRQDLAQITRLPGVERAAWGVVVHSLDRDERVFELNPRTLLVPASSAKLVAVAAAADAVGWDHRFETTLRTTGPIVDGVLRGDLLIVGSGDPSIAGRAGDDLAAWVDAVTAAGIRRIEGRIVGDDDALEEPRPQLAWAWDDLGYTTGAIFGALNLGENRMAVTVTPGGSAGAPTTLTVEPHAGDRPLVNRTITSAPGSLPLLWPEQRPGETFLTVAGTIPAGSAAAKLNVSVGNPTAWFASVFRHRLLRQGVEVTGEAVDIDDARPPPDRASAAVLFTYKSHPLSEIAQALLKDSINLYAEAVLRLNAARSVLPTNDAALEALRLRLESWGIPPDGQQLVDGSGLSRRDVISAESLIVVLRRMQDPTGTSPFLRALPIAGVDGSLENRMRDTPAGGNVRAKTGTMSNIRSMAGYVATRDGERLAFAALVNNFEGTGAAATQAIDAIAIRLASFSRTAR